MCPIEFKTELERNPITLTPEVIEEDLTQIIYQEGEEGQLAIQFLEECGLYSKFLLWQGLQEQLKKLREEVAS